MNAYEYMRQNRAYFEDFIARATYHSNAIEGNTLSLPETYAILWNDNSLEVTATARELYEAVNYKYALTHAMESGEPELREALVKDVARLISKNINEIDGYRRVQVMICGAEHIPPELEQVVHLMMQLVYDYNCDVRAGRDPLEREAGFHIRFERIHPFEDGNDRCGRILLKRGLLLSGRAPAVITRERRARYLELIASRDVSSLTALLAELSSAEERRIEAFKASEH